MNTLPNKSVNKIPDLSKPHKPKPFPRSGPILPVRLAPPFLPDDPEENKLYELYDAVIVITDVQVVRLTSSSV